ncbi:MAG: hypothetical protein J7647_06180 [Cyanobacteria bacterium SBLK]|nr:hypothetical protein [Cyanobacteria bacterium SBLK]
MTIIFIIFWANYTEEISRIAKIGKSTQIIPEERSLCNILLDKDQNLNFMFADYLEAVAFNQETSVFSL